MTEVHPPYVRSCVRAYIKSVRVAGVYVLYCSSLLNLNETLSLRRIKYK